MSFATFKLWFYRAAAVHFLFTAATGLALYFRPLQDRAGLYSADVKEWLVMVHNGEWLGHVLVQNRYLSGLVLGLLLAIAATMFSVRTLQAWSASRS